MKRAYHIIRFVILTLLGICILLPAGLYVALSLPFIQNRITVATEKELTKFLAVDVKINRVEVSPFNRLTFHDVTLTDSLGNPIAEANRLGAGISIRHLFKKKLTFTYAEIIGLDAHLRRETPSSPLNIQPIIDALQPKDKSTPPRPFDFAVNAVVIRNSCLFYDVNSVANPDTTRLNFSHLHIHNLSADIELPQLKNDDFTILVHRISFTESSGLNLKNIKTKLRITPELLTADDISIELPKSSLSVNNQLIPIAKLKRNKEAWKSLPVNIEIFPESHFYLPDFEFILPALKSIPLTANLSLKIQGTPDYLSIERFKIHADNDLDFTAHGTLKNLASNPESATFSLNDINLNADCPKILVHADKLANLNPKLRQMLANSGYLTATGSIEGSTQRAEINAALSAASGSLESNLTASRLNASALNLTGTAKASLDKTDILIGGIIPALSQLQGLVASTDFNVTLSGKNKVEGSVNALIDRITYKNATYHDLTISARANGHEYSGEIDIDNPQVSLHLDARASLAPDYKTLDFNINARNINPTALNLTQNSKITSISAEGNGQLSGEDFDHLNGSVFLHNLKCINSAGNTSHIDDIALIANSSEYYNSLRLSSDPVDANISGNFSYAEIVPLFKNILASVFPTLFPTLSPEQFKTLRPNNIDLAVTVKNLEPLESFVKLPVKVIHPVDITGNVRGEQRTINLNIDAPYLQNGSKIIEGTSLRAGLDGSQTNGQCNVYATTRMPSKKGLVTASLSAFGTQGQLDTQLGWNISNPRLYNGALSFSTRFSRSRSTDALVTEIAINPGKIVINDTTWTVDPSKIIVEGKRVEVDNFSGGRHGQSIKINGVASDNPDDKLTLALNNMDLDYVFETLGIETAMFGGVATGDFIVRNAFTSSPIAYTPELSVKSLKYNHCVLGDAKIRSGWDNAGKAIKIDALITPPGEKQQTRLYGKIMPMADSLDLNFDAHRIPVGFLQYFMSAFATKVTGYASGKARLWGTFKLVDMVGDIRAEDLAITLGFTNTTYTTTDSVHLRPGRIDLKNIPLRDKFGNKAVLNGVLTHKFFKEPSFEFVVSDAKQLLVYDMPESANGRYYGTVFGNGEAAVKGRPGYVDIDINISTAPKSTFTFVLTNAKEATEYNFITFRDRDHTKKALESIDLEIPQSVKQLKQLLDKNAEQHSSSAYDIQIAVDVNDNALINLVMDPVSGDKISAYGNGNLRLDYNSKADDLRMFGKYSLTRGNYNFTLQEIIIKDFTIRDGSSITFHGDPYAAQLNISAAYTLNANLSDLDESFLDDKELTRTNVPVRAILNVTGDVRAPEINFDLEFPTISSDTERKVRSIISTDEMMNRQIIYLLSLSRFYTPDYMSATKGNELVSVASSTISSQLSNMLGQISDNWNISPNFRSDKGDFTDLEVDLMLSSQLLNNRLLLNGNLGYRDKTLNNNSFIGDFDIEYLLNRSGTIRLKAYNHYNDRNYYVKSALTTQGVGVVFRRDFDSFSSFLKAFRRKNKEQTAPADTLKQPRK